MLSERTSFSAEPDGGVASEARSESPPQDRVLTPDELADVAARDSFPASDPPSRGISTLGAPAHKRTPSRSQ
jgi:hypothetical protein